MKKGTKVKFTPKTLRYFRGPTTWEANTINGVINNKADFYSAAMDFAIGSGAKYSAHYVRTDELTGNLLVAYELNGRKNSAYFEPKMIKAVK